MGCCGGSPDEEKDTAKCDWDGSLKNRKRHCTDTIFLIALACVWVIMSFVGFAAMGWIPGGSLKAGQIELLTSPMNVDGKICGFDDGFKQKPYGYMTMPGKIICVKNCPGKTSYNKFICTPGTGEDWDEVQKGNCMFEIESTIAAGNMCLPDFDDVTKKDLKEAIEGDSADDEIRRDILKDYDDMEATMETYDLGYLTSFMGDVTNNSGIIFGFGIGVAVAVALLYVTLLRVPGILDTIIWGVILTIFVCLGGGAVMLWADQRVFSIILFVFTFLYACLILFLRKRIKLAIAIVKEAGHAMTDMPLIITLPVIQVVGLTLFLLPWVVYEMYLASSGVKKTKEVENTEDDYEKSTFEYDETTNYAFLYMMFAFFWTSQFIVAMGQLIVAMTIACWYFTKDRSTLGNSTFLWAMKTSWLHAGTAAFGSLVIAIMKFIRYIILKIQKNLEKSSNSAAVFIMKCIGCCMWCIEKCMKFLNKNAYIQTAIYGYGFCHAARTAFFLLMRNIARVFVVGQVSDFILMLGKLLIPVATTFFAYCALTYGADPDEMNSIIGPLIGVYIMAYFVACMFNEVYGMCIQTILLCYVADEEMFKNPGDRYIPGSLKSTLTATQKEAADLAKVAPEDGEEDVEGKPAAVAVKGKPSSVTPAESADLM